MPVSSPDRVERLRSIRKKLLDVQERRGPACTPTGAKQVLSEAVAELVVFVKLEYPESKERGGVSS